MFEPSLTPSAILSCPLAYAGLRQGSGERVRIYLPIFATVQAIAQNSNKNGILCLDTFRLVRHNPRRAAPRRALARTMELDPAFSLQSITVRLGFSKEVQQGRLFEGWRHGGARET